MTDVRTDLPPSPAADAEYRTDSARAVEYREGSARADSSGVSPTPAEAHKCFPNPLPLGIQPRVKLLRSSYTGLYPQSNFTRGCIPRLPTKEGKTEKVVKTLTWN